MENILITPRGVGPDTAEAQRAAADATRRMRALSEVDQVADPVPAPVGSALLVAVTMSGDARTADQRVTPLLDETSAVQDAFPALRIEQSGPASVQAGINEQRVPTSSRPRH